MSKDSNDIENTGLFTMIPDVLLSKYNFKHMILLSRIARLSFTSGYCNASNEYLFERIHNLTKNGLNKSLDWLEEHGLIIRYNQLKMVNGDFLRTKRLIVLTEYSYQVFNSLKSNSSTQMHEPIECPKGFLIHADYLKAVKSNKTVKNKSTKQHATNRDASLDDKQNEHLNPSTDDVANNASEELKQQEQPENEHIKQSEDDASSMNAFLNKQGIATKNDSNRHPPKEQPKQRFSNDKRNELFAKLCTYYQQKGYEDYVARATEKLEKMEQQAK